MKLLLDTDVCIAILNRDERVHPHLERHSPAELRMSAVTLAELRFGVAKSAQPKRAQSNLRVLRLDFRCSRKSRATGFRLQTSAERRTREWMTLNGHRWRFDQNLGLSNL